LYLFSIFKESTDDFEEEITTLSESLELEAILDKNAELISGGQKRRATIAIAFIGKSKIVIVDEPTSGLDVHSKRNLWDLIKKNKQNRIILMTTH